MGNEYNIYPYGKGFVYLCAVIDWHSRKVLAHGYRSEIFNTDQGSQFTSDAFIEIK